MYVCVLLYYDRVEGEKIDIKKILLKYFSVSLLLQMLRCVLCTYILSVRYILHMEAIAYFSSLSTKHFPPLWSRNKIKAIKNKSYCIVKQDKNLKSKIKKLNLFTIKEELKCKGGGGGGCVSCKR